MKNSYKNNQRGITLIALIITIIVMLILVAVVVRATITSGLFDKASEATNGQNFRSAEEKLDFVLRDAQISKYEPEGLTEEQLTNKLKEIGEVIPEGNNPNGKQVIVDGYIFEIDRSIPKIINNLGTADGIIITAEVNSDAENENVNIVGMIKTYSGGELTKVSAKKNDIPISGFSIGNDGKYEIQATETATYTIEAEDSKGKSNKKELKVEVKITNIAPNAPEVAFKDKTDTTITVTAKATDADGDKLTYILYAGEREDELNKVSEPVIASQGEEVELTVSGLVSYDVEYIWKVEVTDGKAKANSSIQEKVRTWCYTEKCSGVKIVPSTCTGTVNVISLYKSEYLKGNVGFDCDYCHKGHIGEGEDGSTTPGYPPCTYYYYKLLCNVCGKDYGTDLTPGVHFFDSQNCGISYWKEQEYYGQQCSELGATEGPCDHGVSGEHYMCKHGNNIGAEKH